MGRKDTLISKQLLDIDKNLEKLHERDDSTRTELFRLINLEQSINIKLQDIKPKITEYILLNNTVTQFEKEANELGKRHVLITPKYQETRANRDEIGKYLFHEGVDIPEYYLDGQKDRLTELKGKIKKVEKLIRKLEIKIMDAENEKKYFVKLEEQGIKSVEKKKSSIDEIVKDAIITLNRDYKIKIVKLTLEAKNNIKLHIEKANNEVNVLKNQYKMFKPVLENLQEVGKVVEIYESTVRELEILKSMPNQENDWINKLEKKIRENTEIMSKHQITGMQDYDIKFSGIQEKVNDIKDNIEKQQKKIELLNNVIYPIKRDKEIKHGIDNNKSDREVLM